MHRDLVRKNFNQQVQGLRRSPSSVEVMYRARATLSLSCTTTPASIDSVSEAVKESTREPFGTEELGPLIEEEIGIEHEAPELAGGLITSKKSSAPFLENGAACPNSCTTGNVDLRAVCGMAGSFAFPILQKFGDRADHLHQPGLLGPSRRKALGLRGSRGIKNRATASRVGAR